MLARVGGVPVAIHEQDPSIATSELLAAFVPPPMFAGVRFDTYQADPGHPSQAGAVQALQAFAAEIREPKRAKRRRFRRAAPPESRPGVYLDGGFGVGKTHLLASLWHGVPGPKVYGTFVEYTNLVGALGFQPCVAALSTSRLVAIDEFELDDPGDTVLMSSLLRALVDEGVQLAATSNTLPDRLGEGRFASDDFLREIQGLRAHFDVLRIDGDDYRHRDLSQAPEPLSEEELAAQLSDAVARLGDDAVSFDLFDQVLTQLARVHPSRYGGMVAGLKEVFLSGLHTLSDQSVALRLVVLVDRLYDTDVRLNVSGVPVDEIFDEAMLSGGFRKKYFRATSRLIAMAEAGTEPRFTPGERDG